jgi:hypothetical protein
MSALRAVAATPEHHTSEVVLKRFIKDAVRELRVITTKSVQNWTEDIRKYREEDGQGRVFVTIAFELRRQLAMAHSGFFNERGLAPSPEAWKELEDDDILLLLTRAISYNDQQIAINALRGIRRRTTAMTAKTIAAFNSQFVAEVERCRDIVPEQLIAKIYKEQLDNGALQDHLEALRHESDGPLALETIMAEALKWTIDLETAAARLRATQELIDRKKHAPKRGRDDESDPRTIDYSRDHRRPRTHAQQPQQHYFGYRSTHQQQQHNQPLPEPTQQQQQPQQLPTPSQQTFHTQQPLQQRYAAPQRYQTQHQPTHYGPNRSSTTPYGQRGPHPGRGGRGGRFGGRGRGRYNRHTPQQSIAALDNSTTSA